MPIKTRRLAGQLSLPLTVLAVALFAAGALAGWLQYLDAAGIRRRHVPGTSAWWQQLAVAVLAGAACGYAHWRRRRRRRSGQEPDRLLLLAPLGKSAARRVSRTALGAPRESAARGSGLATGGLARRGLASRGLASRGLARRGLARRGLARRGLASRGRVLLALPPAGLFCYCFWRAGLQVTSGLDPNSTVNAWGGPTYLGAMACHYLDCCVLISVAALLLNRILVPDSVLT